jgi:hypothetical protein
MQADGLQINSPGYKAYQSYKDRAVYPELVKFTVDTLLGALWTKPSTYAVPKQLEYILTRATLKNETLEQLHARVHEAVLATGRFGLLLDIDVDPNTGAAVPYIATYSARTILNWDAGYRDAKDARRKLNLVVLDETEYERQTDFSWRLVPKYRVCVLGDVATDDAGKYRVGSFRESLIVDETAFITPSIRGTALTEIPFVFINPKDMQAEPDIPPLKSVANTALTIYRGEADYRQNLYMQSQDTLVVTGASDQDAAIRVGAGATIHVPVGGDAKYIGVSSSGLPEQRTALENDYKRGETLTGQLIDTVSRAKESGDALAIRVAAKTASLNQVARTVGGAIEALLKIAATWLGANADEVKVEPNLDFANLQMQGADLVQWMTAKNMGAPLALETVHNLMVQQNVTENTYEDERALLDEETPIVPTSNVTGVPNLFGGPNDPNQPGSKGLGNGPGNTPPPQPGA